MTSAIFAKAAEDWARMRADFDQHILASYNSALNRTGGVLVNKEGRRLGVDGLDLFYGSEVQARKYASEELLDHWEKVGRPSLAQYERTWLLIENL
jgi:hypothetical protein